MSELREKIWHLIEKHQYVIFIVIITLLSLVIRINLFSYESGDYQMFLSPWFEELKENGGLKALNIEIGNYNAPYMTIMALLTYLPISPLISIKIVSVIFDYVCAIMVAKIALYLLKDSENKKRIALVLYSATVFLPTVFLNSACWAQSDSIYTAFILISLLYLMKKKFGRAFIFLGIAFSFKLQFIFILPLYILLYISERKFSVLNFLWIIVVGVIMCIPSLIFGNSLWNCIKVYIGQTGTYSDYITLNFPNFYGIFWGIDNNHLILTPSDLLNTIGIVFTIAIFVVLAFLVLERKIKFTPRAIIEFGIWSVLICTFFLPCMHERYLFLADILGILYLIYNKKKYYIPLGIELISLYGYLYYLFNGYTLEMKYISMGYLILMVLYSKDMLQRYFISHD